MIQMSESEPGFEKGVWGFNLALKSDTGGATYLGTIHKWKEIS